MVTVGDHYLLAGIASPRSFVVRTNADGPAARRNAGVRGRNSPSDIAWTTTVEKTTGATLKNESPAFWTCFQA